MPYRSEQAAPDEVRTESDFGATVRRQTSGYVRQRKQDVARAVSDVADVIRDNGKGFAQAPQVKAFFDSAADGINELADDIDRRTFPELYDEVEAAIRRRPVVALATAALAGFVLLRLVRDAGPRPVPRSHAVVPLVVPPAASTRVRS